MTAIPEGTVTLLFTDIEGSTRLLQQAGDGYVDLLLTHRRLLRRVFGDHHGYEVDMSGDASFVVFASAREAIAAAQEAQAALGEHAWADGLRVLVRMGLHTGEPRLVGGQYHGLDVHRAARVMAAGHGGQVLLSQPTRDVAEVPVRDLGLHRLKDLSAPERIWQLGDEEFPRLKTLHQTNLPVQPTPLVGRASQLAEVTALLQGEARLVTLTGAGGSGKTRLALHAAAELADDFPDGIWFVPLAAVTDPMLVEPAIAHVLGARDSLKDELSGKRLLLVLDNLEQVIGAASGVAELLAGAADVRVLATSRQRLAVSAEREYVVPTLPVVDAVTLFTERARALQPEFESDQAAIEQIALRLDGLPLALELAAARVKVVSTEQIADRLGRSLDLLTRGARDAPARQQTLRATIGWSHDLLSTAEQRLFRRLAVFTGGWTLETAEAVAEADLDTLGSLAEQSLLSRQGDRFAMLETIRQYAFEKLDESGETRDFRRRHAEYFLTFAERTEVKREREGQVRRLDRLDGEHENFRSATDWAHDSGDAQLELRLVCSLWRYWYIRGHWQEGRNALERALRSKTLDAQLRVRALHAAAWFAQHQGDGQAWTRNSEACLTLARELGDDRSAGRALRSLATAASVAGDLRQAEELFTRSAELSSCVGDNWSLALVTHNLGDDAREVGDLDRALELLERAVSLAREGNDQHSLSLFLTDLGQAEFSAGNHTGAEAHIKEGIAEARKLRSPQYMAGGLEALAAVYAATNRPLEAATLLAAALKGAQFASQREPDLPERELREYTEAAVAGALDQTAREVAFETGRSMNLDEAVCYALQVET